MVSIRFPADEASPVNRGTRLRSGRRRAAGRALPRILALALLGLFATAAAPPEPRGATDAVAAAPPAKLVDALRAPVLSERLQSLLDELVRREPGVRSGLLLIDGPGYHWKGASGVAFAESGLPMLPEDQFNIDSIAKMMTAAIAMKLVEEGKLGLDDRIAEYLPDTLVQGLHVFEGRSYGERITVRQILHHTSGIVDDWACPGFLDQVAADPERRWSPEETIEYVKRNCGPRFAPGDGFHYSDTAYNLLGLVLEKVTGEPLHVLSREMLFDPLGMVRTYRPAYEAPRPSVAGRPPAERYFGDIECGLWMSVMTADWAGGGLVSTVEDLDTFLRAFVNGGLFLDPSTRDTMLTWVESGPRNNYGLGVSRLLFRNFDDPAVAALGEVWGHSGSSHNFMYYWPREDVVIIGTLNQMATESNHDDTMAAILRTILDARGPGRSGGG